MIFVFYNLPRQIKNLTLEFLKSKILVCPWKNRTFLPTRPQGSRNSDENNNSTQKSEEEYKIHIIHVGSTTIPPLTLSLPLSISLIYIYIYDHIYKQIILLSNSNPTSDSKGFSFFFFLSRNHQELERDFREESRGAEMLQLFFAVAFSSVPLTLYIPPLRSLNLFVETMEDIVRETSMHTDRLYPRVRQAFFRILDCMLCNNMR